MEKKINSKPLVVVAFLLALLSCGGFSLLAAISVAVLFYAFAYVQKDQDAALSALSALMLILFNGIVRLLIGGFRAVIFQILGWANAGFKAMNVFNDIFGVILFLVSILIAILAALSALKLLAGKPAGTPIVSTWAAKAMGVYVPKPQSQPQYYGYQQSQQPAPAPAPTPAPTPAPAPAPAAGSDSWTCSCGTANTGNFCTGCGKHK
jgi:hypothetical protein